MNALATMTLAEWRKAWRKKRFLVLAGFFLLLVPGAQLASAAFLQSRLAETAFDPQGLVNVGLRQIATPYNLARNNLGATLPGLALVLCAILGSFLISEDRGYRMFKVNLTLGRPRAEVLAAKFLAGLGILGVIALSGLVGSVLVGLLAPAFGMGLDLSGDWPALLGVYLLQWLVLAAPLALAFLLATLLASPALVVIGVVVLPALVENLLRALVFTQVGRLSVLNAPFQASRVQDNLAGLNPYLLTPNLNLGGAYLGEQVTGFIRQAGANAVFDPAAIGHQVLVCAVYAAVFIALTVATFRRRDVND
ncbi:MAG TPA: ABC transporter permease subunit [Deinococcales bacterium]|nr:ABC transporter permease subunit [Deinococcales bacterium]